MGSRNSSSAGSGSGDPSEGLPQRGAGLRRSEEEEEEDEDVDLAQVLAYLLRRGQVRLVQGGGAANLQLIQALSDSEEEHDSAWDGRLGDRYNPPVDVTPDTRELECNEIKTQVELATGRLRLRQAAQEHSFPRMLYQRQRGLCHQGSFSLGEQSRVMSHFLPNDLGFTDTYSQKAFCGIYSKDGQIFMSACQDQTIRLYDCRYGRFHKFKSIKARDVGWSILDVAFTPDGNHFLYSSWSDYIHICNIYGEGDTHTALDLRPDERRFAVFSIAVSSDGREVLGGANDGCLYVFDREQNRRTLQIESHEDDVNAVAFADISSQILFSGGDDAICKVWDRRTMREDDPKPVGALAGHQDGITFIDSKGDARYLISNSKDQTIKLWDIRRFSNREGMEASRQAATQQNWDYRWQQVPKKAWRKLKLPGDSSLMTYRGHGVLHTLIRCRFSPPHSTGQQFIYTGCSTGKVVVYDLLSGHIVKKLTNHKACVRDVSWHPFEEKIVSSSFHVNPRTIFASHGNFFNIKFVNSAWGWTCTFLGGFVLLVVFLATRRVAVTARHLSRLVVGAAVWRGAGRAFLLIEDLTGSCFEPLPQGLLLHELPDRRSCLAAGHQWRGYTVSSHTFLLTFCCLLMAEEAAVFAKYLSHGLPAGAPLRLVFLLNVLLLGLWNFLLLCTVIYFHQYTHKVVGAAVGTFAWYLTYGSWYHQPWSPGSPGHGLFPRSHSSHKHN